MWLTSAAWLLALGPAYVAVWRGVWGALDLVLLPETRLLSAVVSVSSALLIAHPLTYLRAAAAEATARRPLLAAAQQAAAGLASVLLWRGGWRLLDAALGVGWPQYAASAAVGAAAVAALRCLPTAADMPPVPQRRPGRLPARRRPADSLLGVDVAQRPLLAVLDALLSVLLVQTLTLLVWRGVWSLLNGALDRLADWEPAAALLVGCVGVLICTRLPPALGWVGAAAATAGDWRRRAREDALALLTVLSVVHYWKGVWDLLDLIAVPRYQLVIYVLLCLLGFQLLVWCEFGAVFSVGGVRLNDGACSWLLPVYEDLDEARQPDSPSRADAAILEDGGDDEPLLYPGAADLP